MSQGQGGEEDMGSVLQGSSIKTSAQILSSLKIRLVSNQKHSATYKSSSSRGIY